MSTTMVKGHLLHLFLLVVVGVFSKNSLIPSQNIFLNNGNIVVLIKCSPKRDVKDLFHTHLFFIFQMEGIWVLPLIF